MNKKLVDRLMELKYTISAAESCTGGLFASSIVEVPNASYVFNESFVTYANEAKIKYLAVSKKTIAEYGVVSEEVAGQMALGVCKQTGADVGVGISGIAGPSGGSATKKVGMVCFGICINQAIFTYTKNFGDIGRNEVRKKAVLFAQEQIIKLLG